MATPYHVRVTDQLNDPEWDAFVACVPDGHHVQTSLWAQVKTSLGWEVERIIVLDDNETILAGAQVLIRTVPPIGVAAYITKGPLLLYEDQDLLTFMMEQIKCVCKRQRLQLMAIQPSNHGQFIEKNLPTIGYERSKLTLAPTATILSDVSASEDALLARMKRQTRQNVLRSLREGIIAREGIYADLEGFHGLYAATSRRQGFTPYPLSYFEKMWEVLEPHGMMKLILTEYEGELISGLLIVPFRDTVIAKMLGWSGNHAERRPNDGLFWSALQWTRAHGYRFFDIEGFDRACAEKVVCGEEIPEEMKRSHDYFKLGFGGQVVLYPVAFEHIPNPILRWVYHQARGQVNSARVMEWVRRR